MTGDANLCANRLLIHKSVVSLMRSEIYSFIHSFIDHRWQSKRSPP